MQASVDVLGVVTQAGPLGSVKRKSDSSEVPRRDITITDQRWGLHLLCAWLLLQGLDGSSGGWGQQSCC